MSITALIFWGVFASITVFPAFILVWQKNLIAASFLLLSSFIGIAALFLFTGAEFLAVTQLLIYVGGILTLILFGILITKRRNILSLSSGVQNKRGGAFLALGLFILLSYCICKEHFLFKTPLPSATTSHIIGFGLMDNYLLPFELSGLLLLVALVGVLALASSIKSR